MSNIDKNKLKEKCAKAIRTTMIGALDAIETELEEDLKDPEFEQAYMEIREKILNLGNNQIHNLDIVFNKYEVTSKMNSYNFYTRD